MKLSFLAALALVLAACTSTPIEQAASTPGSPPAAAASAPAPASPPPAPKPEIGTFGLDLTAAKPSVKAGDDFFEHANGTWYDTYSIPDDRASFGIFTRLDEQSQTRVREIIEQAAASHPAPGTPEQKIGDYYASFMDEAAIEANGLTPVRAELDRIAAAKSKKDIATLFGSPGFQSTFEIGLGPDLKNPDVYTVGIGQGGLGLPDRDYYLKDDPQLATIRAKYVEYIATMLGLADVPDSKARAQKIMAFETAIAKVSWPIEQRRDVEKVYNPRTMAQVKEYAKGFDWQAFMDAAELGKRQDVIVAELTAVRDIAKLIGTTPLDTLKDYLTFHHLDAYAAYLPKKFDTTRFGFYGVTMRGQPKQRDRWKRGVDAVNGALGEQVAQVYVAKYFPPSSKAKMQVLVRNLLDALSERIDQLTWMTPETKTRAHDKLATFVAKIGYPDKWKDYSALEVKRGDLIGNVRRASLWDWHRQLARLDQPVDRSEWQMLPQEINAYYNPQNNEIVFPAAILEPPFFDPNADDAVNYGAIGAVIGHEIGHGFDDQGRKFAPDGSFNDWWTKVDSDAFTQRAQKLVAQYSSYEALPGLKVNGANTLGENIGDLGGLNMAYHAYHLSLHGKEPPVIDGLTGDQRFFLSWAQVWRAKYRDGVMRELVMSDVHSPAYFRVNGTVRNMEAWYKAFNVQPGDKLYLPPDQRVSIW
ncbi:MAG TPA: M13 family metallopeptidase [Steroidobacteraceae bacterium]|nr:M13 family metallopeptidase [Steroidobacteraceae bacterium]HVY82542.1 M13 family metallopeptidase [Steroidobacteraceae bacterium]